MGSILLDRLARSDRIGQVMLTALLLMPAGWQGGGESMVQEGCATPRILIDFRTETSPWNNIDDAVMGGLSGSRMVSRDGYVRFQGTVSLENNGGFASIRSHPARFEGMEDATGIILRVRGDGKRYGVRLRTSASFDGVSYAASFGTVEDVWEEIVIPFESFRPEFRGRIVREYDDLDPAAIRTWGFIISDKQAGAFGLDIEWIGVCPGN